MFMSDQHDELYQRHLEADFYRLRPVLDRTNQRIVVLLVEQVRYQVIFVSARPYQSTYSHISDHFVKKMILVTVFFYF